MLSSLGYRYRLRRRAICPSLVYCGDDRRGKQMAAGLIRDAGFDPVDAGPLRIARYTEPFALLVGQLAYEGTDGPELAYRFELFQSKRPKK
jgi:8-hydroxy-5-deazaflavin:NADPH oxidoreductase